MQKTQQELLDIADQMLAQLENDYLQTQQYNLAHVECPEEEVSHQDYHVLGDDEPDQMSDSDEEEKEQKEVNEDQECPQVNPVQENSSSNNPAVQQIQTNQTIGELMEVFPTEEWKAPEKQININSEKIKQFTLNMNLPVPEWMKDEDLLRSRITELFGQKKVK